jgi:hypothetical protein
MPSFQRHQYPNALRDGGTGRENRHCSIPSSPENKKPGNFVCYNMEKMKNRFILYTAAIRVAHRVNLSEL